MLNQEEIQGYVSCRAVYQKYFEIPSEKNQTALQTSWTTAMNVTDSSHPMIFMCYYYYQHPFYHQYHYMATNANCNN